MVDTQPQHNQLKNYIMADLIITITGSNIGQKTLTFEHGDVLNAYQGDQVTWVLGPNCGVAAITAITDKPESPDLFSGGSEPAPQNPQKTVWEGTLDPNAPIDSVESYSITWTSVGGGWHGQNQGGIITDPKIQIKPGHR